MAMRFGKAEPYLMGEEKRITNSKGIFLGTITRVTAEYTNLRLRNDVFRKLGIKELGNIKRESKHMKVKIGGKLK